MKLIKILNKYKKSFIVIILDKINLLRINMYNIIIIVLYICLHELQNIYIIYLYLFFLYDIIIISIINEIMKNTFLIYYFN